MNRLKETLTQEERREIFKDLCARIYHGVRVTVIDAGYPLTGAICKVTSDYKFNIRQKQGILFEKDIDIFDENIVFYPHLFKPDYFNDDMNAGDVNPFDVNAVHDFCMFWSVDMHNLIGRGLAIDVVENKEYK